MIGKVSPADLAQFVLSRTGVDDPSVVMGPTYGEDTAAIDLGDQILVVNADPISLAVDRIGTIGVNVVANDVAASGAQPRWLTDVIFLPDDDPDVLDSITRQLDEEATRVGVSIVGGHAEYAPELSRPVLSLTCFGLTDRYVSSAGAQPGDLILLTRAAGIEGTGILASDFGEELADVVAADSLDSARRFTGEVGVVDAALAIREFATAMHDPTEGGVLAGLVEMAIAADATFEVERDRIPVRPETVELCAAVDVDPLRIFGSGALLATISPDDRDGVFDALHEIDVPVAVVGQVTDGEAGVVLGDERYREPVRDDLYELWE